MNTVTISEDIARKALSLAYSRIGQSDAQGEQARTVARALYDALDDRSSDHERQH